MPTSVSASSIEDWCRDETAPSAGTEPTLAELKAKAACFDWLVSGRKTRQGVVLPAFGTRQLDKNPQQSLLSFSYWCTVEQLRAAIEAEIAKEKP